MAMAFLQYASLLVLPQLQSMVQDSWLVADGLTVEGALTMFFAVVAVFMLPDFPHNTRFGFTKEEIQVAQLRMLEDVRSPAFRCIVLSFVG